MCGIAGFINPALAPDFRGAAVARMCAAMQHRGPDDDGFATLGPASLGMRRLAIFDPAHGHQPMQTADGRFTLIFNGAIYNFRSLRTELQASGHVFRTECDTEVLLAAYAQWGEGCLGRLRGMFAFAVWDTREATLFLARDPFGIKPLYYRHDGASLLFASELNALIASGACPAEIDPVSVGDYLAWFAVPAPRTIYRGIFSLRPGECATLRDGRFDIRTAWNFRSIPQNARLCRSRTEFIGELRERLEDSIRAHMLADVPVGAFLSGGLDSAAVVGLMSRASGSTLRTFSIEFAESAYSEAEYAAATARHFGTEHHPMVLTGARVAGDVERLLATLDQPTGDGVNTYYASLAARSGGVTVALSGLGGDELFGGYPNFQTTPQLARWLPPWRTLPRGMRSMVIARLRRGDTRRRKLADILEHARDIHHVGALQRRIFSDSARSGLLAVEVGRQLAARSPFHPELASLSADLNGVHPFEVVSAWELRTYMADVLLRDSDVMSMRHSLELRVPLVDRELIEWVWQQPAIFKADSRHPKAALRDALADILPSEFSRRIKRGFTLPFALWMKRELRPFLEETFSDASIGRSGLFDSSVAPQMWRRFLHGDDPREWSRLWSLAVLIGFANRRAPAAMTPERTIQVTSGPIASGRSTDAKPATPMRATRAGLPPLRDVPHRSLLLAPEIFASEGGIARMLQIYLKALCELRAPDGAVRMLALNDTMLDSRELRRCTNEQFEEWRICSGSKVTFTRAALQMSRRCTDVICGHAALLPVARLAKLRYPRLRYHLIAHGIEVWRPFSIAERIALRSVDRVLCVSEYTRRQIIARCPHLEKRAVVVPNALDPTFRFSLGHPLKECAPEILAVTRLLYADRYKGVEHLIEALPEIRRSIPTARLRIVGRGDDARRLQAIARKAGVGDAVTFAGYLDDTRLAEALASCRLFALPSEREGFGIVFVEAMAHGRPCLGARAGGVPEVISAETGILVEYGNVRAIAAGCVTALQRDWDQERILAHAREFSYESFLNRLSAQLST